MHLSDECPDGTVYQVQDGIAKLKFRDGFDEPKPVHLNEITETSIEIESTSYFFAPGHRLLLDIASSAFPRYVLSDNGGGDGRIDDPAGATIFLHHSSTMPSRLELPAR